MMLQDQVIVKHKELPYNDFNEVLCSMKEEPRKRFGDKFTLFIKIVRFCKFFLHLGWM